jgi:alpha-beta hydrolase superfamily lysophospholipase
MEKDVEMPTGTQTLQASDGLSLHQVTWEPAAQAKASFVITHGLGEHSGRYDHMAKALNTAGIAVYAIDLRGHGHSDGARGHTPGMAAYLDDLDLLIDSLPANLPLFFYGHSLGGLIAIHYTLHHPERLKGLLASAPAIQRSFEVPVYKLILGRMMSMIWPTFSQETGLNPDDLTRMKEVNQAYRDDPLVHAKASARLFTASTDAGPQALKLAAQITLPTVVIQAGDDRIVSAEASQSFFNQLGAQDKTWIHIPDAYHETHNEAEGHKVIQQMVEWVLARV